jgi:cofilin
MFYLLLHLACLFSDVNMVEHYQEGPVVHHGGDDLADDFIEEEEPKPAKSKKAKQEGSKSAGNDEKNTNTKAKAKQSPKVVKFFG